MIQEQNALIGMSNKYLWKKAHKIFVAFDFKNIPSNQTKPINLGIPLRSKIYKKSHDRPLVLKSLGLHSNKNVLLVLGGSLGAKVINEIIEKELGFIKKLNFQIIWQCGQLYAHQYTKYNHSTIKVMPFISDISMAYSLAHIIICRAGASTIAELACVGKPTIFIPSPNVADNHQYHNAIWLQNHNAAVLIEEKELSNKFKRVLGELVGNPKWQKMLGVNFKSFARPQATRDIVNEIQSEFAVIGSSQKYYFIGIGGIGMSGLAGYLKHRGCQVAGYDLIPSPMTENLGHRGIEITYSSSVSDIPNGFNQSDVTVVYTPAIPKDHHQLTYFNQTTNTVIKRAALLGQLSQKKTDDCGCWHPW